VSVSTDEWPPFRIANQSGGFSGFDIDLLGAITEITDLQFNVKRTPWARALKQLQYNQVNMMTGLAYTKERALYIDYIEPPYFICHPAFYIQTSLKKKIKTYQELYQYKIGYVLQSAYFEPFDSDPKMRRHGVVTESQLIGMAAKGRIDLFIGSDCHVDYEISQQELWGVLGKVEYQPEQNHALYLGIAKHQNVNGLASKLKSALIDLQRTGRLQAIQDRYFPDTSRGK
ncbi:MAG: amino acid ABC transporter substrate-binding protein, partial [Alteromonadales bacterium]|nr:amino acid ABC transporter substrate-binding protein [Alteromonadales bacterium]